MKNERTRHILVPPSSRADAAHAPSGAAERTVRLPGGTAEGDAAPAPASGDDLYSLYAIQSKIGDGGMGVVYMAKDRRLGRYVAIKRLNRQAQAAPALRNRFLQEARAVAALNHIHIVHIYALGEDSEGPYIVMEYVPGPDNASSGRPGAPAQPNPPVSLDAQVGRNGQYTVNEAIDLLVKISKAIAYAHGCGVIHRDLKPTNILLDVTGEPKIVDFGLARLMRDEESKLTVPGEKLLSLGYGAPEQESDASVSDERADVYGLGALLYFAITGQNPRYFREQDIPVPLRETLVKALATDREQRWGSATAFLEALQAVQSRTRVETPTAKTTWRCKWCDTVNPLTIRFCSECGWDGGESCPECGAESFVGVQYCGNCGADARAYEGVAVLLRRMQSAMEGAEFERVAALAGRAQGFEPAGPAGRDLVRQVQEQRAHAQRQIARRNQLKDLIPLEIRAENFERARDFIKEYRTLSGQPQLLAEEERQLPQLTLKRDLRRARQALRNREWEHALNLCDGMLRDVAPDDQECLALRRAIVRRQFLQRTARAVLAPCALLTLYLLSMPPTLRLVAQPVPRHWQVLYRPALWFYRASGFARPLAAYARLCGVGDLAARFAAAGQPPAAMRSDPVELVALQSAYQAQLRDIERERRSHVDAWPEQYAGELDMLMERRRAVGDFEAWNALNRERQQFAGSGAIGASTDDETSELLALKQKFRGLVSATRAEHARRIVAAGKKYVNDLNDLLRTYTKDARMEDANSVNDEIQRARTAPEFQASDALLADLGTYLAGDATAGLPTARTPEERLSDLLPLRQRYDEQLAAIEAEHARNVEQWPEKYISALNTLMERYQAEGDYTGWQAVNNEIDRFEIDRVVQPGHVVVDPAKLAQLQRQQLGQLTGYRTTRARAIVNLAERQMKTLADMQRKFTIAGKMEAAGDVNGEIRRLRAAPEVLAAQAELAPPPAATNAVPDRAGP